MNRQNIWIHLTLAIILIIAAAILGQIRRWQSEIEKFKQVAKPTKLTRTKKDSEPEVLVRFRSDVSMAEIRKIAAKLNDRVEDEIESVKNLVAIDDLDGLSAEEVAEEYRKMSDLVLYAEPNYEIKIDIEQPRIKLVDELIPNDPLFGEQWALNNTGQNGGKSGADIKILKTWQKTKGSKKVVVAVLDSGVDYQHLDLISNIWVRPDDIPAYQDDEIGWFNDTYGFNAIDNLSDPMDENGHGTHCAGIIGAEGNNDLGIAGINWQVEIMPLKFLGRNGSGTTKDAIEAINYAIDRKQKGVNIRIINASWGSRFYSKALEDAIRAAGEVGILFVAAAGNSSSDNDQFPHYPASYNLPNVISVAALDRDDKLASFSNYGAKTVHVAAPGKDIISTWLDNEFKEASGTSMAAPHVSGIAALIVSVKPEITVEQLKKKLIESVDKIDSLKGKIQSGGRINALKAVEF
jgi:subtilisin family serine protease